jgi:hypothetical protein
MSTFFVNSRRCRSCSFERYRCFFFK